MRFDIFFGVAIVAAALSPGVLHAQSVPAEMPPASYTARQYVDSKGCVWVRAGSDVAPTWVPRVSRDRKQICNATPTQVARSAPAPAPVVVAQPVTPPPTAPVVVRTAPPVKSAPPPQPASDTKTILRTKGPYPLVAVRVPETVPAASPVCPDRSGVSKRYTNHGQHGPVRCGPQAELPYAGTGAVAAAGSVPRGDKIGTKPFEPVAAVPTIAPGYRPVWDDGRLNPNRPKPAKGAAVHVLQWTNYAPYRLIDTTTGHDVTAAYPHLKYPYTDYALQKVHLVKSSAHRPASNPVAPPASVKPVYAPLPPVAPKDDPASPARMSSKTDPAAQPKAVKVGKGHRYVQLGAFADVAARDRAFGRAAGLGLPMRAGTATSGGTTHHLALVGPFDSAVALGQALVKLRGAGFGGATTR